jgi:hypothetical protein
MIAVWLMCRGLRLWNISASANEPEKTMLKFWQRSGTHWPTSSNCKPDNGDKDECEKMIHNGGPIISFRCDGQPVRKLAWLTR